MKRLLLTSFLFSFFSAHSQQNCDREKSFDSLHAFLKENYAGYDDKVNNANRKEFEAYTLLQKQAIKKTKTDAEYFLVLRNWAKYFKDEHLSISIPFDTANGKLTKKIAATEVVPVSRIPSKKLENADESAIEGIYYTADSNYRVAVIKSENGFRKYAGVVLSSRVPEWEPGFVKFELIPAGKDSYDAIFYNRYHHPTFSTLSFGDGNSFHTAGWYKKGYKKNNTSDYVYMPPFPEENTTEVFFKQIDDQTSYLRIGSFDAGYIAEIDSVVKANKQLLESLPYLVIDIRGNGGGADIAYRPLKRLMYTDTVRSIGVDFLATSYNIDITKEIINSIPDFPAEEKKEYNDLLERARQSGKRMFNLAPDNTETGESIPLPKKIAVVINGRCASTAEQFILEARQSKKVTLFGTHSMGVLDYANVREKSFCNGFTVRYPTTRSRRIDIGQGIDNIGIMPDVEINMLKPGWLTEVVEAIKK